MKVKFFLCDSSTFYPLPSWLVKKWTTGQSSWTEGWSGSFTIRSSAVRRTYLHRVGNDRKIGGAIFINAPRIRYSLTNLFDGIEHNNAILTVCD